MLRAKSDRGGGVPPKLSVGTPAKQQGVVLFIALIALVALTLAAIALTRSVDTGNLIAGNIAFQQSATNSGDNGIESAIAWLTSHNSGQTLFNNDFANGYVANRQDPGSGKSWADFFRDTLVANNQVKTIAADASGNTVSYVIHRMCATSGDPNAVATGCATNLSQSNVQGNSRGAGSAQFLGTTQVYYRITAEITGPRNTKSLVQAIVLM